MKFSIRDLLLVTVIVALAAGWWVDRRAREGRIKLLEKALSDVALYGSPVDWPGIDGPNNDRRHAARVPAHH